MKQKKDNHCNPLKGLLAVARWAVENRLRQKLYILRHATRGNAFRIATQSSRVWVKFQAKRSCTCQMESPVEAVKPTHARPLSRLIVLFRLSGTINDGCVWLLKYTRSSPNPPAQSP